MKRIGIIFTGMLLGMFFTFHCSAADTFRVNGVIAPVIIPANISISTESSESFSAVSLDGTFYVSQNIQGNSEDLRMHQFEMNLSGERIYTVVVF